MKALSVTHQEATRGKLLALAKQVPGAWIGIKIAALSLRRRSFFKMRPALAFIPI